MNQEVEVTIYRFWNTYSVNTTQFRFVQGDSIVNSYRKGNSNGRQQNRSSSTYNF